MEDQVNLNTSQDAFKVRPHREKSRCGHCLLFFGILAAWVLIDFATKRWFTLSYQLGQASESSILGLLQFRLVYNTGAAWGVLGDSTFALGVFSILMCLVIGVFFVLKARTLPIIEIIGIALVVGGGLGNAFDRFTLGYVVDFIEPLFIEFPVFNVADIGVTCGVILFLIGILFHDRADSSKENLQHNNSV